MFYFYFFLDGPIKEVHCTPQKKNLTMQPPPRKKYQIQLTIGNINISIMVQVHLYKGTCKLQKSQRCNAWQT
jgi:hypothetical protein